jgi:AraC family transcriptional regulator
VLRSIDFPTTSEPPRIMAASRGGNLYGGLPGRRLNAVFSYIDTHLAQPLRPRQLARLANVGARHFERAFRQAVGVPLHAYVIGKRVTAAQKLLLTDGRLTMGKIAKLVGFSSASHLAFAFHQRTGYTPTAFRRRNDRLGKAGLKPTKHPN